MVDSITSQGALVSWPPAFSILPVTQYNVNWVQVDTGEDNSTTIADMTQLLLTNLQPNRNYSVTVVAVNRVGASLLSDPVVFTTAEDGRLLLSQSTLYRSKYCTSYLPLLLLPVQYQRYPRPTSQPPQPDVIRLMSPGNLLPWKNKMDLSLTTMSATWLREEPRQSSVLVYPHPPPPLH